MALPLLVVSGAILAALALVAVPNLVNARHRGFQKRTMSDMRSIATAMESYAIDRNAYPSMQGTVTSRDLAAWLVPTYIKQIPQLDGWGSELAIFTHAQDYTITSLGSDRRAGSPPGSVDAQGRTSTFAGDIVYSSGTFIQYPDGTMR